MNPERPQKDISQIFQERVLIDKAMQEAFMDAIETHRRAGVPMVFWKDGKIVHMTAEEVLALQAEQNGKH